MKAADVVFCLSETMKLEIKKRGVKEEKIAVIRNGAPSDYLNRKPKRNIASQNNEILAEIKKIRARRKIVGYVGSIEVYEGLENLISVIEMMIESDYDVHLLIISNNDNKSIIEKQCTERNLQSRVTIVGPIPRSEIRDFYELIDVVVIPRLGSLDSQDSNSTKATGSFAPNTKCISTCNQRVNWREDS